jgi:uncharacterized RDD family membrane protein YckC
VLQNDRRGIILDRDRCGPKTARRFHSAARDPIQRLARSRNTPTAGGSRAIIDAPSQGAFTAMDSTNQYAPPRSVVVDISGPDTDAVKAGRGTRLGAYLVDFIIWGIWFAPVYIPMITYVVRHPGARPSATDIFTAGVASNAVWLGVGAIGLLVVAFFNIVLVRRNGQSIAKKWLGIKVVRADGTPATLSRIFWLRNVVPALFGVIPYVGRVWGLIDSFAIFTESRRCIHDYIADTIVIRA